jgi:hypothetical protein
MEFRTDRNRNPAAFTIHVAKEAGLVYGTDYVQGDVFQADGFFLYTAKLLGDPVELTVRVIDKVGFYTQKGAQRWIYIAIPPFVWTALDAATKARVIGFMYHHEGGTEMLGLFA